MHGQKQRHCYFGMLCDRNGLSIRRAMHKPLMISLLRLPAHSKSQCTARKSQRWVTYVLGTRCGPVLECFLGQAGAQQGTSPPLRPGQSRRRLRQTRRARALPPRGGR